MDLKEQLTSLIKGQVLDDEESLKASSRDASIFEVKPRIIAVPENVSDIKNLVKFVGEYNEKEKSRSQSDRGSSISQPRNSWEKSGLSLTARSGATDMTGGPLTQSIVVDVAKHLNQIKEVGNDFAVTEPGVFYRDFEKATLEKNLLMPSYPASREICTVGGMVANNSGGEKSLTYGKTIDYVQQLKVVLSDGNEYSVGPLNKQQLSGKLKAAGFEGDMYRSMFKLCDDNYDLIKSSRPNVSKNSAGYQIWDVWNKDKQIFDLSKVIVGSQGTLGLVTEINFKLIKPKLISKLLVIFLRDLDRLPQVAQTVLRHRPESFESYDDKTLKLALRYLPQFIKSVGAKNLLSLFSQFLPEMKMVFLGGIPKMVLMAEFTGDSQADVDRATREANRDLSHFDLKVRVTKDEHEIKKYWTIRRESFNLLRRHIKNKQTAPFVDDVIVRPEFLPKFLPEIEAILDEYKLQYSIVGHVGNGNFHIIPLMNLSDPKTKTIIPEVSEKVYDLVLKYKGSITAEHNDGLIRSPFLKKMYGDEVYHLFEEVKRIFDPNNIFNPGKKVGSDWNYAMSHIKDEHTSYHW